MEKAYIVLAHKNANQVLRLLTALDDGNATFFLHLDKKCDPSIFTKIKEYGDAVVFIEKVDALWGGFSLVQATLHALKAIQNYPKKFEYITLLSGQHYPIKSNAFINDYLRETPYKIFIEYTSIPNYQRWRPRGGMFRIDKYFLGLKVHQRIVAKTLNFLSGKIDFFKRKLPKNMKPYAGSQWWTIDNQAMDYILEFVENNPDYTSFHKRTFAPDELFFHNILLNATDEFLQPGITNNNLLYMNWPDTKKGHPETLQAKDLEQITSSDALFARKFDMEQEPDLLDYVDTIRVHKSGWKSDVKSGDN